jgi:hypothetical protein
VFADGQIYVALSRARSSMGVTIVSKHARWIPRNRIKASQLALDFDNKMI